MQSLGGMTILVTRPPQQARDLCERIQQLGGSALAIPVTLIRPLALKPEILALQQTIQAQDIAVFLSANAVIHTQIFWRKIKSLPMMVAIGAGTAKALEKAGLPVDALPQQYSSEGLLQLDCLQHASGRRIYLCYGVDARPLLQQQLSGKNQVIPLVCYAREAATLDEPAIKSLQTASINCIVTTSQEILMHFYHALLAVRATHLLKKPLVVIHQKHCDLAKALGFETVVVARNGQADQIIAAIFSARSLF